MPNLPVEGKSFRDSLHRPSPINKAKNKSKEPRTVPPFSLQSLQRNTVIVRPPRATPEKGHPVGKSRFKRFYHRGDLPICIEFGNHGNKIAWKTDVDNLNYEHFLPVFFDGLCEVDYPYTFFARQGIHDLLIFGQGRILPTIPRLVVPIRNALNTKNHNVVAGTLKVLQHLAMSDYFVGIALVPYYRQILAQFNIYKDWNHNLGDEIEYSQRKRENIGDLVTETLQTFEKYGGPHAYVNIKYMVPSYESYIFNH